MKNASNPSIERTPNGAAHFERPAFHGLELAATLIATASLRRKPQWGYVYCGRLSAQRGACFLLRHSCAGPIAGASTSKSGYEDLLARPMVGKDCEALRQQHCSTNSVSDIG
jgi:hypothetical protein